MYNQNNICSLEQILKEYPTVEIFENKEYKTTRRTQRRGYLENMEFETTEADMARLFANEKRKLIKVWLDSNDNIIRWVFKGESGINPTHREMTSEEISDLHRAIKKCINFRSDNNTCKATNYDDVICPMLNRRYVGGLCRMLVKGQNNKPQNQIRKATQKCKFCGKLFEIYKHQIYCCEKCRIAGTREMNKLRARRHRDSKK